MSKVVIACYGTRGDVVPLTGIGVRLQDAGHEVVMAAPEMFAALIRDCGLEFRPIALDLGLDADVSDANPLKLLMAMYAPKGMRALAEGVLAAIRDVPADLLPLSPMTEFAGHQIAEAKGVPAIGVRMQPLSATAEYPPVVLGAWSVGSIGNRMVGNLGAAVVDRLYSGAIAGLRAQLGLPRRSAAASRRRRTEAGWPILYGYSPSVVARPADWRPGIDVVGYWWPQRPLGWQPPESLVRFLDDGPPPVFLGFGSLINTKAEAERVSELVLRALRAAGARGVIQAGWAGLDVSGDDVLTIGEVPHDWLFDRVAAVAHACGAGTTAAVLRAGVPAIAVPFGVGDQPFWARRLRELGVSAGTLSQRKLTADGLAEAIRTALTDPGLRDNAKRLAPRIAEDDGAGQVLATVERLVS